MKTYLKYGLAGLLLMTSFACQRDILPEPKPITPQEENKIPKHRKELKGLWDGGIRNSCQFSQDGSGKLKEDRYLGLSYDLMKHKNNNSDAFLMGVVDFKSEAWSPFGGEVSTLKPKVYIATLREKIKSQRCQTLSEMLLDYDFIKIHSGKNSFVYRFHHEELDDLVNQKNCVVRSLQEVEKEVYYLNFKPEVVRSYLRWDFVKELIVRDAEELVQAYGTHLVGGYQLGSTLNFTLYSDPYIFTEEETKTMESWLWKSEGKPKYNPIITERMYPEFLSVNYRQMGSDYRDNSLSHILSGNLFAMIKAKEQFNEEEWSKGFVPNSNRFVALDEEHRNLIAIPDLIEDIPLKIKYTAGILHRVARNNDKKRMPVIRYVLSDPTTHKPIILNKQALSINLKSYKDAKVPIYLGNSNNKIYLDEKYVKGFKRRDVSEPLSWKAKLSIYTDEGFWNAVDKGKANYISKPSEKGLWTFMLRGKVDYYLCRDLKLRTEQEDKEKLRFWLLNPIMPDEYGNSFFDLSRLFIQ